MSCIQQDLTYYLKKLQIMPYSYPEYKEEVKTHILNNLPLNSKILDVGPGCGTYSHLLRNKGYKMDCIEVWEPYVDQFNLREH